LELPSTHRRFRDGTELLDVASLQEAQQSLATVDRYLPQYPAFAHDPHSLLMSVQPPPATTAALPTGVAATATPAAAATAVLVVTTGCTFTVVEPIKCGAPTATGAAAATATGAAAATATGAAATATGAGAATATGAAATATGAGAATVTGAAATALTGAARHPTLTIAETPQARVCTAGPIHAVEH